jgi:KaiC/GvpD/RAD55 family RecA-like ATPase
MRKPTGRLPLFNLPSFAKTDLIVFCEGERDCAELHGLGITATTAPMGADAVSVPLEDDGKLGLVDLQPLAGKIAVLWADFDGPGRRHMQRAERILSRICPRPTIKRIQEIDIDNCKDPADFIKKHGDNALRMVLGVINRAVEVRPSDALRTRIEDTIAGRHQAAPWPWAATSRLTQSLRPGAITLLAGNPGSGKSFFLLQACLEWLRDGLPIALLELEEGPGFWLSRALALESANSDLLDLDWMRLNGDKARDLLTIHRDHMDALAQVLTTAPAGGMTIGALAGWIEEQAKAGKRIIAVDPVTVCTEDPNEKPWIAANRLMSRAKHAITASGASLVLATHGRKGTGKAGPPTLDDIAGGAAYQRLASSVILLERLDEPEAADCIDADGRTITDTINRRLRILKAREGQGTGMVVGFDFDGRSLRFSELGTLVNRPETRNFSARTRK